MEPGLTDWQRRSFALRPNGMGVDCFAHRLQEECTKALEFFKHSSACTFGWKNAVNIDHSKPGGRYTVRSAKSSRLENTC
jgi:hypothetical protein